MDQNNKTAKVALRAVHRCERYLMYLTPQVNAHFASVGEELAKTTKIAKKAHSLAKTTAIGYLVCGVCCIILERRVNKLNKRIEKLEGEDEEEE